MNFFAQSTDIESKLVKLETLQRDGVEKEKIENVRGELEEHRTRFGRLIGQVQTLRNNGVLEGHDLPNAPNLRELLLAINKKIVGTVVDITKGRDYSQFLSVLKTLCDHLGDSTFNAWQIFCSSDKPVTPPLELLSAIPGQRGAVNKADVAITRLTEFVQKEVPTSEDEWKQYIILRNQAKEATDVLSTESYPESVRQFFSEVRRSQEGAPYNLLTDEVLDWLRAHKMLQKIRIQVQDN
jgi:hypothetical protein